jgi:alpha-glucosidase
MNSSELLLAKDDKVGSAGLGRLRDWRGVEPTEDGLLCRASNGALRVQFIREGIVRITLMNADFDPGRASSAVLPVPEAELHAINAAATVAESDSELRVASVAMTVSVGKADFSLSFYYGGIELTRDASPACWNSQMIQVELLLDPEDLVYGLGEKTGFLDKRGRKYAMWNSDVFTAHDTTIDPLYISIPFYIGFGSSRAYGFFLDNPYRSSFDMGSVKDDTCSISAEGGNIDYYIIGGGGMPGVLARYTSLTGRSPIPPKWALGNQQSRYGYRSQRSIEAVASRFRDRDIPLDAIYLDIDYMDGYRVFTWDNDRFPDPAAMTMRLSKAGVHTVAIVDVGVKIDPDYLVYRELVAQDLACKGPDGEEYSGDAWPGPSAFPDFAQGKAREWWGGMELKFMERYGIDGIWHDMNEPSVFNAESTMDEKVVHGGEASDSHARYHNVYALLENQAAYEALREGTLDRPFLLSRAGFAGLQRYAAAWTGDNRSMWEHLELSLPMILNMGLSGLSFVGANIGGFACDANGELLARWYQLGAFYPLCWNHCERNARDQEPWSFGETYERVIRQALKLRYALAPELYTAFYRAHIDGTPVMRPLAFDYPLDRNVYAICDQFLFGDGLMVAPILRPGVDHRAVYLPAGVWTEQSSGERLEGGRWIVCAAPLDRIPVFILGGHAILTQEPGSRFADPSSDELKISISVDPSVRLHSFQFYDDDGTSLGYEKGKYRLDSFRAEYDGRTFTLIRSAECAGYVSRFTKCRCVIRGLPPPSRVEVDGYSVAPRAVEGRIEVEAPFSFTSILIE